jgi:hypothetical protein
VTLHTAAAGLDVVAMLVARPHASTDTAPTRFPKDRRFLHARLEILR